MMGVYKIENTVSGKFYIGSSVNMQKRWHNHLYALRRGLHPNRHLQNAWKKYGNESFLFSVVEESGQDNLSEREQYWLDKLGAVEQGYNVCDKAGEPSQACKDSGNNYWETLTEEEKFHLSEKRAETAKRLHHERFNETNIDKERWDDEGGAADRWLRENDPDYGSHKKTGYLTARQYKYRARDKEVPIDPAIFNETVRDAGRGATIHSEGMEWLSKKPRQGEPVDY